MAKIDRFWSRVFETVLACILGMALVIGIFTYFEPTIRSGRESALHVGLANMRTAIAVYRLREGRPPDNLETLMTTGYTVGAERGTIFIPRYLEGQALDDNGHPLDPFGNRFVYEKSHGTVRSSSVGYEDW